MASLSFIVLLTYDNLFHLQTDVNLIRYNDTLSEFPELKNMIPDIKRNLSVIKKAIDALDEKPVWPSFEEQQPFYDRFSSTTESGFIIREKLRHQIATDYTSNYELNKELSRLATETGELRRFLQPHVEIDVYKKNIWSWRLSN